MVNDIIARLKTKVPYALVEGGGHDVAGTVGFVAAAREDVLAYVRICLSKVQ